MSKLVETLAARGRHGDTMLAHITPQEGQLLQSLGGSGTTNPDTGLKEFFIDPVSAIAAGGSLLSGLGSLFGGNKEAKMMKKQLSLQRDQMAFDREIANRTMDAQLGKQTDAYGNTIEYDPITKEWKTTFEPNTKRLADASLQEEIMRASYDQPLQRTQRGANAARRSDEGRVADSYLSQLAGPSLYTPQGITGTLAARAMSGIDDAYRGTAETASRQNLRSGSGGGQLMAQLASERARDTGRALQDAEVEGLTTYEALESGRTSRLLNPYNTLASRASNVDDVAFAPEQIGSELSAALQKRSAGVPAAGYMAAQTAGKSLPGLQALLTRKGQMQSSTPGVLDAIGTMLGSGGRLLDSFGVFGSRQQGNEGLLDPNTAENPLNWGV